MSSDARAERRRALPRVLVVEDDMMVTMLPEDMLADLGYRVVGPALGSPQRSISRSRRGSTPPFST